MGPVCEWLLESLAGIKPGAPGFATLELAPCLTSRLDYVKASFESVQGCISVHWKRTEDGFEIELESPVPVHVRLPALDVHLDAGYHVLDVMPNADLITA